MFDNQIYSLNPYDLNDSHLQYYALMTQTNFEMGISKSRLWCEKVEKLESISHGSPYIVYRVWKDWKGGPPL